MAAFPGLGSGGSLPGSVNSLLGSMRAITTSNPGSNRLLNPLYTEQAGPDSGVCAFVKNFQIFILSLSSLKKRYVISLKKRFQSQFPK